MQTFKKAVTGAGSRGAFLATLAAAAALIVAGTADQAEAQLFPWGWQGQPPWKAQQRRQRRAAPRYEEPKDEKVTSTLPKPDGPLLLVVSLGDQTVTVYDGTKKIATSPISSGMRGHETPTGIFSLLEKNRYHYSNLYGGAPMPFMERVTNSGVALHAGQLPGYPASHGCIRLPYSFARSLFGITDIGARVIITNGNPSPAEFKSAHLVEPLPPEEQAKSFNMTGVTPAAAEVPSKVRTRAMAAAERAAKREQLAASITVAENGKKSADDYLKLTTELAHEAKDNIRKARRDADRLATAARKAERSADKVMDRFSTLTRKLASVDVEKLDAAEVEKQSADELAEEAKALDAVDDARAARALAARQKRKIPKVVAAAEAAEKVRKSALADQKTAAQSLADAKAALAAADLIEARKDYPVSVFISSKTGRLVAKLGFKQVIDVPVKIAEPKEPLGTHVLTATAFADGERSMRWTAVTYQPTRKQSQPRRRRRRHEDEEAVVPAGPDADAAGALARIEIPQETREQLAELMKPGSSFLISDYGLSRESSDRTEFVIEPWRARHDEATVDYY